MFDVTAFQDQADEIPRMIVKRPVLVRSVKHVNKKREMLPADNKPSRQIKLAIAVYDFALFEQSIEQSLEHRRHAVPSVSPRPGTAAQAPLVKTAGSQRGSRTA